MWRSMDQRLKLLSPLIPSRISSSTAKKPGPVWVTYLLLVWHVLFLVTICIIEQNSPSATAEILVPFWYRLARVVPDKGPSNGCACTTHYIYKKLSFRRGTARCVVSVEILPIARQQCRNYLYDKSCIAFGTKSTIQMSCLFWWIYWLFVHWLYFICWWHCTVGL